GETFLKDFRAAKLHYQTPKETTGDLVGLNVCRSDAMEDATEGLSDGGWSTHGLLSRVGLRAGISAPPELAQAVLEGVFWCRVMLEDGDANTRAEPTAAIKHSAPAPLPHSTSSGTGHTTPTVSGPPTPIDSSSSFGRLSAVRTNLYELCLAILLGGDTSDKAGRTPAYDTKSAVDVRMEGRTTGHIALDGHSSSVAAGVETASDTKSAHEVGLGGGTTPAPCPFGGGVSVPGSRPDGVGVTIIQDGHDTIAAGSETASDTKSAHVTGLKGETTPGHVTFAGGVCLPSVGAERVAARARPLLREGDEWVVKEFRRVGESVKPVQVFCQ
ncbi:unnamed protein product, partial [Laminaria digitata]